METLAQAALCSFTAKCSSCNNGTVSYTEEMISQRLIAGLANQEHQAEILSEAERLKTLEMKNAFVQKNNPERIPKEKKRHTRNSKAFLANKG